MTQAEIPQHMTGTVGFTRKRQVAPYESAEAALFIQFTIEDGDDGAAIIEKARNAFTSAKGVVLEQLGLEMEISADGVLVESVVVGAEAIKAAFPGAQEVPPQSGGFLGLPDTRPKSVTEAEWTSLKTEGAAKWFDNRESKASGKYKPTAADFKPKTGNTLTKSVWLTSKAG